jgi:hypothetical protein
VYRVSYRLERVELPGGQNIDRFAVDARKLIFGSPKSHVPARQLPHLDRCILQFVGACICAVVRFSTGGRFLRRLAGAFWRNTGLA